MKRLILMILLLILLNSVLVFAADQCLVKMEIIHEIGVRQGITPPGKNEMDNLSFNYNYISDSEAKITMSKYEGSTYIGSESVNVRLDSTGKLNDYYSVKLLDLGKHEKLTEIGFLKLHNTAIQDDYLLFDNINEGESKTYTLGGDDYSTEVVSIDGYDTVLKVNDQTYEIKETAFVDIGNGIGIRSFEFQEPMEYAKICVVATEDSASPNDDYPCTECDLKDTLEEGDQREYPLKGLHFTVKVDSVSLDNQEVRFIIGSETKEIKLGQKGLFSDGLWVHVISIDHIDQENVVEFGAKRDKYSCPSCEDVIIGGNGFSYDLSGFNLDSTITIKYSDYKNNLARLSVDGIEQVVNLGETKKFTDEVSLMLLETSEDLAEVGIQIESKFTKKDVEQEEPKKEKGITEPLQETKECEGCILNENCIPYSTRIDGKFCSIDRKIKEQKTEDSSCQNNYECVTNVCIDSKCIGKGLIQKILDFLGKLFK